ncbi:GDYXXLXY domain-containing protein [Maricaulaceae bacterium MS644]
MSLLLRLLAVALVMSVILAGLVARHAWLRSSGHEIYLEMEPVDPRDVLLGHYVQLRTGLHELDTSELDGPDTGWMRGDRVYVALSETGTGAVAPAAVYHQPPAWPFILGRVHRVQTRSDFTEPEQVEGEAPSWSTEPIAGTERDILQVRYNLERYYAPNEQALALESMRTQDRLRLIVSLAEDGSAVIKGLEIDGEPQYDTLF